MAKRKDKGAAAPTYSDDYLNRPWYTYRVVDPRTNQAIEGRTQHEEVSRGEGSIQVAGWHCFFSHVADDGVPVFAYKCVVPLIQHRKLTN